MSRSTTPSLLQGLTVSVPEAGQLLGIGRDAAYAAASRGELPVLRLGRTLRVPVPRLLELLGIPQTDSEFAPASATTALTNELVQGARHAQDDPQPAEPASNVRPIRGL